MESLGRQATAYLGFCKYLSAKGFFRIFGFQQSLPTFAPRSLSYFEHFVDQAMIPESDYFVMLRVKRLKTVTLINIVDFGESLDKSHSPTLPVKYGAVKNWDLDLLSDWMQISRWQKIDVNIWSKNVKSIKNATESKCRFE